MTKNTPACWESEIHIFSPFSVVSTVRGKFRASLQRGQRPGKCGFGETKHLHIQRKVCSYSCFNSSLPQNRNMLIINVLWISHITDTEGWTASSSLPKAHWSSLTLCVQLPPPHPWIHSQTIHEWFHPSFSNPYPSLSHAVPTPLEPIFWRFPGSSLRLPSEWYTLGNFRNSSSYYNDLLSSYSLTIVESSFFYNFYPWFEKMRYAVNPINCSRAMS